ncbi:hypothetical protein EUGRSUZ_D01984 [Eucalyptus grandis]|uniref:Uncharacterized protein n=2 Tax=Eucalyptus grandis TaxID=71139 RepID=A0ACC3L6W6_EUCGR|nr:hypothetical protein EUGRSUZ_D01984 [Eucalyptus grandis]
MIFLGKHISTIEQLNRYFFLFFLYLFDIFYSLFFKPHESAIRQPLCRHPTIATMSPPHPTFIRFGH